MKKIVKAFSEEMLNSYPLITTLLFVVIAFALFPVIGKIMFVLFPMSPPSIPLYLAHFLMGALATVVFALSTFVIYLVSKQLRKEIRKMAFTTGINLFWVLSSRHFKQKDGTTVYYRKDAGRVTELTPHHEYLIHRIDGPAVIGVSGEAYFWLNGFRLDFEEFIKETPISNRKKLRLMRKYPELLV